MSPIYLHLAAALFLATVGVLLAKRCALLPPPPAGRRRAAGLAGVLFAAMLVPVGGLSGAQLLLSLCPTIAFVTPVFCANALASAITGVPLVRWPDLLSLSRFVLVLSLPVFGGVLGLWPVDFYALGYGFSWVHLVPVAWGMGAAWRGHHVTATVLLAGLLAQPAQVLPSDNLFDGLTDGLAFFTAVVLVFRGGVASWAARRRPAATMAAVVTGSPGLPR